VTAELDGPFATGSRGATRLPGQEPLHWLIREVTPPNAVTTEMSLEGAALSFEWGFVGFADGRTRLTTNCLGGSKGRYAPFAGEGCVHGKPTVPALTGHLSLAESETRLTLLIDEVEWYVVSDKTEVLVDAFTSKLKAQGVAIRHEDNASRLRDLERHNCRSACHRHLSLCFRGTPFQSSMHREFRSSVGVRHRPSCLKLRRLERALCPSYFCQQDTFKLAAQTRAVLTRFVLT
jgi:hypothetical protein